MPPSVQTIRREVVALLRTERAELDWAPVSLAVAICVRDGVAPTTALARCGISVGVRFDPKPRSPHARDVAFAALAPGAQFQWADAVWTKATVDDLISALPAHERPPVVLAYVLALRRGQRATAFRLDRDGPHAVRVPEGAMTRALQQQHAPRLNDGPTSRTLRSA